MDILINKNFIRFILLLSLILNGCSENRKSDAGIVIKIGNFTVDRQQYENQLKKLITIQDQWTCEEAALFLLDSYITTGLLVETAKKLNYSQKNDFIESDSIHKRKLIVKYNKYLRANVSKSYPVNKQIIERILQNEIRIDYIRIPKKNEELSKSMFLYFTNGSTIPVIFEDPELTAWNNKGLSFYENISLKDAILTNKVIEEIMMMQEGEIKIIKDNTACYIIRLLESVKSPMKEKVNIEPFSLNQLMARSLENGDAIFDPYRLEQNIKCDEILLSKIDFSIKPFYSKDDFVVEINGKFIRENEIKEQISGLPVKIQSLFENKSTRIKAIAMLVLLHYNQEGKPKKVSDWLQPYKINNYEQLKFDFEKIEKMGITQNPTIDDQILTYSDNWSMTVKNLKEELDKLTPMTRLDIANKNLLHQMIEYLVKRSDPLGSKLIINSNLFESIDIMGKSYDQLNYVFDENSIVGTLGNIDISVQELRKLVIQLGEFEKKRFLDLSTRRESFNEIIIEKLWLNLYDRKIIEDNPDFKKEVASHQNKFLVELLYDNDLKVNISEIGDGHLNLEKLQAAKSEKEGKLFFYIQTIMGDYPIQVKGNFFQKKLNLNLGDSKYREVIIKNLN